MQLEKAEIERILAGGAYDEVFWHTRLTVAKSKRLAGQPTLEMQRSSLRIELGAIINKNTVQFGRQVRKIQRKMRKLSGQIRKRDSHMMGYAENWADEEKRLDNLQHAANYIHRANTGFHFYA